MPEYQHLFKDYQLLSILCSFCTEKAEFRTSLSSHVQLPRFSTSEQSFNSRSRKGKEGASLGAQMLGPADGLPAAPGSGVGVALRPPQGVHSGPDRPGLRTRVLRE